MRIVVPLAVVVSLLAAGCGSETATDVPARGDDLGSSGRTTELTVVVHAGPGEGRQKYVLTCDPAGGDHPDPDAACRELAALDEPFAPVPTDSPCTEIYGGPQTARVTGTYRAEPVDTTFERTDGCEISRWGSHVELLVERGGAESS